MDVSLFRYSRPLSPTFGQENDLSRRIQRHHQDTVNRLLVKPGKLDDDDIKAFIGSNYALNAKAERETHGLTYPERRGMVGYPMALIVRFIAQVYPRKPLSDSPPSDSRDTND
jgi:hypothetical protein